MEWRPIKGFEGIYEVSDNGDIKSLDRTITVTKDGKLHTAHIDGKLLNGWVDSHGYRRVNIKRKGMLVHRIVAKTFIDNKAGYSQINHIDGNKLNNNINNLEWCDNKHNAAHNFKSLNKKQNRRIGVRAENISTNKVLYFSSVKECSEYFNIDPSGITKRIRGKVNNPSKNKSSELYNWILHPYGKYSEGTDVVQLDNNLSVIAEYKNARLASKIVGVDKKSILEVMNHECGRKTAGGYVWMRKSEAESLGLVGQQIKRTTNGGETNALP